MSSTPIADLVEKLIDAGVSVSVLLVAIRTIEQRDTSRSASRSVTIPNRSKAALRAERYRNNLKHNQALAKANDVANTDSQGVTNERDASRDGVMKPCDLSSSLLPFPPQKESGIREESKGRARGSRLLPASPLPDADRKFAVANGVRSPDALWVEFVDYWVGIPGQRGVKLDWSATWRNRVRQVATKGGTAAASRLAPNRIEGII